MATLATFFKRNEVPLAAEPVAREFWDEAPDQNRLRPIPCEDVYFYCKKIDNSRLVREANPRATKKAWKTIALSSAATLLLVALLLPKALGMAAGYQLHALQREHQQLVTEKTRLELEEARLLSPQRLEELARSLKFVDPVPGQIMYLEPKADSSLALNLHK